MNKLTFLATLSFLLLIPTITTHASCGSITGPENLNPWGGEIVTVPISDCVDPFGVTIDPVNPYTLLVNAEAVADGGSVTIPESGQTDVSFSGEPYQSDVNSFLFKHVGDDYEYIAQELPFPEYEDELQYIDVYFSTEVERSLYAEILQVYYEGDVDPYFYNSETDEYILDPTTGEPVEIRFWDFYNSFYDYYFAQEVPSLTPGTYTMVFKEYMLFLTQNDSWLNHLRSFFIPTAYAQCATCIEPNIYTITFTLLPYAPEPTGASSVLFLPGIQSSRLYQKNILGFEDQLWVPTHNGDVRQLAMTATGESENDIYTKEIVDSVTGLGTVYAGISGYFDTLVAEDKIADWEPFAYDWRYSVDEIVTNGTLYETERKYVLDLIETMAEESDTGKVSLVGHSNGGLLAKMIVAELEKLGKEDLIDQVVFLASPQTGTPKAIGSLLHGYGQEIVGGLILQADTAREVIQNLPGAYALLPTKEYFEDTGGAPVVVFEDVESTQAFIDAYGSQITDVDKLRDFMTGWGEDRAEAQNVYEPIIANYGILVDTANLHTNVLQAWRAPDGVKVTEVAGIGLPTIHSFAYRAYMKKECGSLICPSTLHYKPVPQLSLLGDETVMTSSAVGYRGEKDSYYFNLKGYREVGKFQHYNFTEAESIHNLLSNLLLSATNSTPFITKVAPSPSDSYMMIGVHSPVMATVTDGEGRQIKVEYEGDFIKKTEDIPDAYVSYFGETTYMILPKDSDYQVELSGTGSGSVTLELDNLDSESSQTTTQSVLIDSVSTSTMMTTTLTDSVMSDVLVDEDGDGEVDKQIDAETNEVLELSTSIPVEEEVDNSSSGGGGGSGVRRSFLTPQVAGAQISLEGGENMEYLLKLYELLLELRRLLLLYEQIN